MSLDPARANKGGDLRADANTKSAGGGIDAKYSTVTAAADGLTSYGRAGPTNDDQPTFCWTREFSSTPHVGHPQCFDFEWSKFVPRVVV